MSYDLKIINRDLKLVNGQLQTVTNGDKLVQDILKLTLSPLGANPLYPSLGSTLSSTIVGNIQHTSVLVQIAKSQLITLLENLKSIQDLQLKSFQRLSADEQLASIKEVSVVRNQIDPRLLDIKISVISKGLNSMSTNFSIQTI